MNVYVFFPWVSDKSYLHGLAFKRDRWWEYDLTTIGVSNLLTDLMMGGGGGG